MNRYNKGRTYEYDAFAAQEMAAKDEEIRRLKSVAVEQAQYEEEIAALRAEVERLKKNLARRKRLDKKARLKDVVYPGAALL